MSNNEKVLPDGMFCKPKNEGAPDFVICKVSFSVEEAIATLKTHANERGYVNMDFKLSKGGKHYLEIDTWKPDPSRASAPKAAKPIQEAVVEDKSEDTLPF